MQCDSAAKQVTSLDFYLGTIAILWCPLWGSLESLKIDMCSYRCHKIFLWGYGLNSVGHQPDFFSDDELPPKGREHTLHMHIMVKCEDIIVSRVLIDNGSTLDACSMSTIERLNVDTSLLRPIAMIIRAFDYILQEV